MPKTFFPKSQMSEIEVNNKQWIAEYEEEAKPESKGYYQKIANFFKFLNYIDKPFNTFTIKDVEDYIYVMMNNNYSSNTINSLVGALSGFRNFHIEKHPDIFPEDFLNGLQKLHFTDENASDAEPLTLKQLSCIREYNERDFKDKYVFEIFFQLGIMKKDLFICQPLYQDKGKSAFIYGYEIFYNTKIEELTRQYPQDGSFDLSKFSVDYYLYKATQFLRNKAVYEKERQLNYSDIIKSHEVYIFRCPNCRQLMENIETNWVLAKWDFEKEYRLVCNQCKGEINGSAN